MGDLWSEADEELFEKLRTLRMEIARKEKVPPYIVFSDKTPAHMSVVKPVTREAMLTVSGVGEFKYKKYGEKFLECLRDAEGLVKNAGEEHDRNAMAEDIWTDLASSEDLSQSWKKADKSADKKEKSTAQSQTSRDKKIKDTVKPGRGKSDFAMTSEPAEQVYYSERISLSDFVAHLNELRDEKTMKRLTIKAVEEELLSREYFGVKYAKGRPIRTLAPKGMDFGIEAEFRYSEKGNEYEVFYYTEKAQRGIVEWPESCAEAED